MSDYKLFNRSDTYSLSPVSNIEPGYLLADGNGPNIILKR
jgi:hypothetical protein